VPFHPPGGAGVFPNVVLFPGGLSGVSGSSFSFAARGVAAHPPGSLGVLESEKFGRLGVGADRECWSESSSSGCGGRGRSGIPRGGLGVWYSRICCWRCGVRRGGVTSTELEEGLGVGDVDRFGSTADVCVSSSVEFVDQLTGSLGRP